jgi:hypothetical protein
MPLLADGCPPDDAVTTVAWPIAVERERTRG